MRRIATGRTSSASCRRACPEPRSNCSGSDKGDREGDTGADARPGLVQSRSWLRLRAEYSSRPARQSFGEAVRLGASETLDKTLVVFKTLRAIGSGKVSTKTNRAENNLRSRPLGCPPRHGQPAPLPHPPRRQPRRAQLPPHPHPRRGAHGLLAWEAVRGKPADERVQIALTLIGLALILALMVALGLDFGLISRNVH